MSKKSSIDLVHAPVPGILRRLAAIFYDGLLLLALLFVATAVITLPLGRPSGASLPIFQFFIFEIIPLLFFTGFWTRGGQTLGMRAWRLKLIRFDGGDVSWGDALKRHLAALLSLLVFGLGFIWILVDPEKLAWHDRLSQTRLIIVD
ncbi:MAG: transporter [gamma proteobacterium symbiont of Ctena orbiculata]|uniref:RDD family protein n=1 Tax=Candidatus Thiodiazotropha taylori TaxID=2792791 RepID=A0A944MD11_9GAMM|nr:RDD family protein [Candidatus Thiodiazotropha taylori]PUB81588.1 MAG: RDD family protein [gamma proteobacterium symbiont of Ctena orbiculata]MBT2988755.1 RDD family protein [Candidatus Thiodiazotropha taylori]MBT2998634.1 RDD family protein [Candidatus Thiodiazotropha taylori]MBT3001450.1 RDD family protein [Candidatus Thiodiazotropha taylori]